MTEKIPYYRHGKWSEIDDPWKDRGDVEDIDGYGLYKLQSLDYGLKIFVHRRNAEGAKSAPEFLFIVVAMGDEWLDPIGVGDLVSALNLLARWTRIALVRSP
jgi:hypothetical protein